MTFKVRYAMVTDTKQQANVLQTDTEKTISMNLLCRN